LRKDAPIGTRPVLNTGGLNRLGGSSPSPSAIKGKDMIIFMLEIVFIVLIAIGFALMWRNKSVYEERKKALGIVHDLAVKDIHSNNLNWEWRFRLFDRISYDKMLYEFWRPVKSYFNGAPELLDSKELITILTPR
jgi:hypothetical protein